MRLVLVRIEIKMEKMSKKGGAKTLYLNKKKYETILVTAT